MQFDGLVIQPDKQTVLVDEASVRLTETEHALLRLLAGNTPRVFSRREIIDAVQGKGYPATDRSVDVQMTGLRKKLARHGPRIETVRGKGYRFRPEA